MGDGRYEMDTGQRTIGIFGMGLLGGSIAFGLRERGLARQVLGHDPDPEALVAALARGAIDRTFASVGPWVAEVDIGILAAPVRALPRLAATIAPHARPDSIWCDIGSTKGSITPALEATLPNFVGTHPMAGRETAGVQNAYAGLLQNAIWVVCAPTVPNPNAVATIEGLIAQLGAFPISLGPSQHDRAVARISHLPWLLAVALNLQLADDPDADTLLALAAGGFRDLTRVASGAPEMSRDMVTANAAEVKRAISDLQSVLQSLEQQLDEPDELLLQAIRAKRTRDSLPIVRRSLLPRVYDVVIELADKPLELARLTTVLGEAGINIRDIEILKIRDGGEAIRVGVASDEDLVGARAALFAAGYRHR